MPILKDLRSKISFVLVSVLYHTDTSNLETDDIKIDVQVLIYIPYLEISSKNISFVSKYS